MAQSACDSYSACRRMSEAGDRALFLLRVVQPQTGGHALKSGSRRAGFPCR